jgi:hypothetical protein
MANRIRMVVLRRCSSRNSVDPPPVNRSDCKDSDPVIRRLSKPPSVSKERTSSPWVTKNSAEFPSAVFYDQIRAWSKWIKELAWVTESTNTCFDSNTG